jgi:hypothetical protein
MKSSSALTAIFACALLAGCASMQMSSARAGGSQSDPCTGDQTATCKVVVSVTGCAPDQITVDLPKVYVGRGSRPTMQFEMSFASRMAGWRFATNSTTGKDGIVFKTEAGRREFTLRGNSQLIVTFTNAHSASAVTEYEYGINVVQLGGSGPGAGLVCPQKDPWVVNL